jgi:hypothetical protein
MVSNEKKWIMMNPIQCWMKKYSPSSGQNNQLMHWWLLVHSGLMIIQMISQKTKNYNSWATNNKLFYTWIVGPKRSRTIGLSLKVMLFLVPSLTFLSQFHPQFECSHIVNEIGYSLWNLPSRIFFLTRLW